MDYQLYLRRGVQTDINIVAELTLKNYFHYRHVPQNRKWINLLIVQKKKYCFLLQASFKQHSEFWAKFFTEGLYCTI